MNGKEKVLITGGTSGLGLELVRQFLNRGYYVVTTGRREINVSGHGDRLRLYMADFCNLRHTADTFRQICKEHSFMYVIYNAGILSPPDFIKTDDGFELTYQVNFLAHLLANEIIIQHHNHEKPLRVAAVSSMACRVADPDFKPVNSPSEYRPWRAYSDSKFYLALMCRHYSTKFSEKEIQFFSYDPGIFGSRLYRTQSGVFRIIYQTGVKILRKPTKPAVVLSEIITGSEPENGVIYNVRKRIRRLPEPSASLTDSFIERQIGEISNLLQK